MALLIKKYLKSILFGIAAILFSVVTITSCTYSDELVEELQKQDEFIFSLDDLDGYENWTVLGTMERLDLGHFRTMYINKPEEANRTSGLYPNGTIIIKESRDYYDRSKVVRYQIMVKRGGTFNLEGNGWEWAIVKSDQLELLERGGSSLLLHDDATCHSCHEPYNDFVIKTY